MIRGAKPVPTAVKNLRGTTRPDRGSTNEPKVNALEEVPDAPDWLNAWAKDEWAIVIAWLMTIKMIGTIDLSIVAAYCQQMGIFRESEDMLKVPGSRVITTDKGYEMPSAWVTIGNKALMQALKIATEYGLTPSSRSRINLPKDEDENDPLSDLINGTGMYAPRTN